MATREMRMMNITDDEKSSIPPPQGSCWSADELSFFFPFLLRSRPRRMVLIRVKWIGKNGWSRDRRMRRFW